MLFYGVFFSLGITLHHSLTFLETSKNVSEWCNVIPSEKKLRKITLLCQFKKKFFICDTSYVFWKNKFDKWQYIFKLLNSICIMTCMSYSCNVILIDVSHTLWKLYLKKLFSSLIFWQKELICRCGLFWQDNVWEIKILTFIKQI